jgi:hypothetical protein
MRCVHRCSGQHRGQKTQLFSYQVHLSAFAEREVSTCGADDVSHEIIKKSF